LADLQVEGNAMTFFTQVFIALYFRVESKFPAATHILRKLAKSYTPRIARKLGYSISKNLKIPSLSPDTNILVDQLIEKIYLKHETLYLDGLDTASEEVYELVVFGILPPSISSIGRYNATIFAKDLRNIAVVAANIDVSLLPLISADYSADIYRSWTQIPGKRIAESTRILLSLGNSEEHIYSLREFLDFYSHKRKITCFLQVHDGNFNWIIDLTFGKTFSRFVEALCDNKTFESDLQRFLYKQKFALDSINVNFDGIICHTSLALQSFSSIYSNSGTKIIFIDIPQLEESSSITKAPLERLIEVPIEDRLFRIGTFGAASSKKGLQEVYAALSELAESDGLKFEWLLAGFGVENYFHNTPTGFNIRYAESPTDTDLLELMKTVNVAVQWRISPEGEASGVLRQLDFLNIPTIYPKNTGWVSHNETSIRVESLEDLPKTISHVVRSPKSGRKQFIPTPMDIRNEIMDFIWKV
jgi:hypothetical protein